MNSDRIPMYSPGNPIAYDNVSFEEEQRAANEEAEAEMRREQEATQQRLQREAALRGRVPGLVAAR